MTTGVVAPDAEPSFWTPRILIPFAVITLIWGSTWIVIKDQIAAVPPEWSVCYRFLAAAAAMFVVVRWRRLPMRLDRRGQLWAMALGLTQFTLNFNFVYRAEGYITSGLVAVLFALLMVPNAALARIFLGQRINAAFLLGSLVAIAGVALLFVQEYRQAPAGGGGATLAGVGLTACAILCASVSNVLQAAQGPRAYPILTILAWAMVWGALADGAFAWISVGPPVVEPRLGYVLGIAYLGIVGSAVAFPIYFGLIREIGAARAAYNGVVVPVIAMIISTMFEGYRWSAFAAGGAVLAIVGLVIAMQARRPRTPRLAG